jgi:hypothetical protein
MGTKDVVQVFFIEDSHDSLPYFALPSLFYR